METFQLAAFLRTTKTLLLIPLRMEVTGRDGGRVAP